MKEIFTNLFIGNDSDCSRCITDSKFSIVHACKTCHQEALGYSGALSPSHPSYLIYEKGNQLFLNLVDMPKEFLPKYTHPIFRSAFQFINREIQKKVLIHCNMGQSRSPSVGLVYLASKGIIPNNSFSVAVNEFIKLYPEYMPGTGILLYMQHNWNDLMNL